MGKKFCVDCLHHLEGRCVAPQNVVSKVNLVTREHRFEYRWTFCSTHRTGASVGWFMCRMLNLCGEGARWYKPRVVVIDVKARQINE